jgi:acetyltransferase-like isoleucine patch superfamily enzyme
MSTGLSLNRLRWLRREIVRARRFYYRRVWGMDIDPTATFSLSVKFDKTNPKGVHIGARSYIAFDVAILAHDMTRGMRLDTRIGRYCFIGARSIILPGLTIGDESIVAAGSVVTKDVPPRSIVAGNPAQVIRRNVRVGPYGQLVKDEDAKPKLVVAGGTE